MCGSRLLDERIKRDLKYIVKFVLEQTGPPLAALWLGGAYGRGEGAVFRNQDHERPWFGYELYPVYQQRDRGEAIDYTRWETALSRHLSLPVTFCSPGDRQTIAALEPRLRWFDLCNGYRVIWGEAELIPQLRGGPALPPEAALNLLLYWGGRLLSQIEPALEVWYGALLALGDAWLLHRELYHVSLQERGQRFHSWLRDEGSSWRELGYLYQEALQYRLQPSDFAHTADQLPQRWPQLRPLFERVYLALFAQEVHRPVSLGRLEKLFREQQSAQPAARQLRHLLANLRQYRGRRFHQGWYSRPLLHRLYFLLPFVLAEQLPGKAALSRALPNLSPQADYGQVKAAFLALWTEIADELV